MYVRFCALYCLSQSKLLGASNAGKLYFWSIDDHEDRTYLRRGPILDHTSRSVNQCTCKGQLYHMWCVWCLDSIPSVLTHTFSLLRPWRLLQLGSPSRNYIVNAYWQNNEEMEWRYKDIRIKMRDGLIGMRKKGDKCHIYTSEVKKTKSAYHTFWKFLLPAIVISRVLY